MHKSKIGSSGRQTGVFASVRWGQLCTDVAHCMWLTACTFAGVLQVQNAVCLSQLCFLPCRAMPISSAVAGARAAAQLPCTQVCT